MEAVLCTKKGRVEVALSAPSPTVTAIFVEGSRVHTSGKVRKYRMTPGSWCFCSLMTRILRAMTPWACRRDMDSNRYTAEIPCEKIRQKKKIAGRKSLRTPSAASSVGVSFGKKKGFPHD